MPDDPILQALIDAVSADFEVFGELGRREDRAVAFLARNRASDALVALVLSPAAGSADDEYSLEVCEKLDASVPAQPQLCAKCEAPLRPWARYCTRCGNDASGLAANAALGPDELRKLAEDVAGAKYQLLGEMPRAGGGGAVYFGRNRQTDAVAALRLEQGAGRRVAVNTTQTLVTLDTHAATDAPARTHRKSGPISVVLKQVTAADLMPTKHPTPKPSLPTLTGNERVTQQSREDALAILGLPATASAADIRRRYEDLYSEYRVRETNAPTGTLRAKYKASLAAIEAAGRTLSAQ